MRAESTPEAITETEEFGSLRPFRSAENEVTEKIIRAAIEIHRHLGPGLLESAYEECLCYELSQMGVEFKRQVHLPVHYKEVHLDCAYRMDLVVADAVVVEIKSVDSLVPIHSSQLGTYLKLADKPVGLLINFNVPVVKDGLKRIVNHFVTPVREIPISSPPAATSGEDLAVSAPSSMSSPRLRVSAMKESL